MFGQETNISKKSAAIKFNEFKLIVNGRFFAWFDVHSSVLFNNLTVNSVLQVKETEKPAFKTLVFQLLMNMKRDELVNLISYNITGSFAHQAGSIEKKQFTGQYNTNNSTYLIFQRFNLELEKYFKTYHDVSSYAERLNISHRKLSDVLRLFVGKSTLEVIQERIITEAKRSLMYSGQSIQEIAFELGFEDPFYFSKVFKKVTGQAPKAFRVTLQKFTWFLRVFAFLYDKKNINFLCINFSLFISDCSARQDTE